MSIDVIDGDVFRMMRWQERFRIAHKNLSKRIANTSDPQMRQVLNARLALWNSILKQLRDMTIAYYEISNWKNLVGTWKWYEARRCWWEFKEKKRASRSRVEAEQSLAAAEAKLQSAKADLQLSAILLNTYVPICNHIERKSK